MSYNTHTVHARGAWGIVRDLCLECHYTGVFDLHQHTTIFDLQSSTAVRAMSSQSEVKVRVRFSSLVWTDRAVRSLRMLSLPPPAGSGTPQSGGILL